MSYIPHSNERYIAHNYAPVPVMLERGEGSWLWDEDGRRYLDMLGAYSAVSFGHGNPRLVDAMCNQARKLDTTSRAYLCRILPEFLEKACILTGMDRALPMNSGAEAVETALKAARKWGYTVKGIPEGKAEIIVCNENFHGRTLAITSFSTIAQYKSGFGPFVDGFKNIPFANAKALEKAITPYTVAFLVEPVQGEAGIIVPPEGYLRQVSDICRKNNVLFIADEVQSGLGRTGYVLACEHEGVQPDGVTLGKALGAGLMPVSLFAARKEVIDVFQPGDHGSTFGGNPIACAIGLEALNMLVEPGFMQNSANLGKKFVADLHDLKSPLVKEIRGRGLFIGVEFDRKMVDAHRVAKNLAKAGILTKDTHHNTVRFAPPLTVSEEELEWALSRIDLVLTELHDTITREERKGGTDCWIKLSYMF